MIARDKLTSIGTFAKPHGVKGEISATVDDGIEEVLENRPFVFVEVDGLMVPFSITDVRPKSRHALLLTIKGVTDEKQASGFAGKEFYMETAVLPQDLADSGDTDGFFLEDLIGYFLFSDGSEVGVIADYDDSTANVLLKVERPDGTTLLVPVSDELVENVDPENKKLEMYLPEGLLDL